MLSLKDARLSQTRPDGSPLRLKDVADRAGVSVSLVCMVEKGLESPSREAIALAVGASYGSFWGAAPLPLPVTHMLAGAKRSP